MLDSETRRRIDTARDILVGKVPDPKSQVEQITIALIYKFMEDMDIQSVDMGGKRSFFKGKYDKYSWSNIFDPRLGGLEMLALYGEAITGMSQNENLPQLFRDIFKNAFLPYREPETLKLFLKTINEFTYDHSEKLGDAFEYLLSVLGSQGEAGQFRTPRHIIDFMVKVVDPKKTETILDPACGTAGFLISSYKHILQSNQDSGKPLTTQEKQRLYENFTGYDISPDMVRLSLVNLYLHGFVKPQIHEYDTLTSEERWNEYADVVLANPPFMSPKGGIKPHKRFSVQSNRSEVLFVDYMAEHLTPNGRAAIIVPEGIIFQSAGAYKQLRKYLIEQNYLWAVVSLPAGVFNPYAGVKTSILFLDKALAKKTDQILFVKVEADGFDPGAQRRPIDRNDLPDALNILNTWKNVVASGAKQSPENEGIASSQTALLATTSKALFVSTSRLAESGDYILSIDRYREVVRIKKSSYPLVRLGDVTEIQKGTSITKKDVKDGNVPVIAGGQQPAYFHDEANRDGDVITVSASGAYAGFLNYFTTPIFASDCTTIKSSDETKLITFFLYLLLKNKQEDFYSLQKGMGQPHVYAKDFVDYQIPLPPLEIQRQIVDEIAAHQRIIDGARQVVEKWKPTFEIYPDWDLVKIGEICELVQYGLSEKMNTNGKGYKTFRMNELVNGFAVDNGEMKYSDVSKKEFEKYKLNKGDLLFNRTNSIEHVGRTGIFMLEGDYCFASYLIRLVMKNGIDPSYVNLYMNTEEFQTGVKQFATRAIGQANINATSLQAYKIPLPPLKVQREIVARIERERSIVEGNRELIRIYEEKIKKVIERVWEE